jgi:hypothetical protein
MLTVLAVLWVVAVQFLRESGGPVPGEPGGSVPIGSDCPYFTL